MLKIKFVLILIVGCLITACSNVKPYPLSGAQNLTVKSKTDDDVAAGVDIYHVGKNCKLEYQGTVSVTDKKESIHLAVGKINYLVVHFSSSSFWTGSHSMSHELLFKPTSKKLYSLNLNYMDNIYNIELEEKISGSKKYRETRQLNWSSCN